MSIKEYAQNQWEKKYKNITLSDITNVKDEWKKWKEGFIPDDSCIAERSNCNILTYKNLDMAKPEAPKKPNNPGSKASPEEKKKYASEKVIYSKQLTIYNYMVDEIWKKTFGFFLTYGSPEIYGNGQFGYNFGYAVSFNYIKIYEDVENGRYEEFLKEQGDNFTVKPDKITTCKSKIFENVIYKENKEDNGIELDKVKEIFEKVKNELQELCKGKSKDKDNSITPYYRHKILILESVIQSKYDLPFIKTIEQKLLDSIREQDKNSDGSDGYKKEYEPNESEKWVKQGQYIINTLYRWINKKGDNTEKNEDTTKKLSAMLWDLKLPDNFGDIDKYKQIIYTGAPGTGKTYGITEYVKNTCIMYSLDETIVEKIKNEQDVEIKQWEFVQFHSSYDYSDFVEGLRPVQIKDGQNPTFVRMDGIFKEFCRNVIRYNKEDPNKEFYFIIDEINRADIGKVFGELMYCLDEDYRGEDKKVKTQYKNLPTYVKNKTADSAITDKYIPISDDKYEDGFYIPHNIHIIGSMNDIDRSVETFDFALRRRFQWKEIKALGEKQDDLKKLLTSMFDKEKNNNIDKYDKLNDLVKRIKSMNMVVSGDPNATVSGLDFQLNESYQIGASYFKKFNGEFAGDSNEYGDSLETIWKEKVEPTLREYVRGNEKDLIEEFIKNCRSKLLPDGVEEKIVDN